MNIVMFQQWKYYSISPFFQSVLNIFPLLIIIYEDQDDERQHVMNRQTGRKLEQGRYGKKMGIMQGEEIKFAKKGRRRFS